MAFYDFNFKDVLLRINEQITLKPLDDRDTKMLFSLVNKNSAYLGRYLPWVEFSKKINDTENFVKYCKQCHQRQSELHLGIFINKNLSGVCSLTINHTNQRADIGYWIAEDFSKRGIMTLAVKTLIHFAFKQLNLNKVIIHCDPVNSGSIRIAEKLNFKYEGRLREHEKNGEQFNDLFAYSLLEKEWEG